MAKKWEEGIDYSVEIEKAKAEGRDTSALEAARAEKIKDVYGGKEPTMNGSDKTYSQLTSERGSGSSSAKKDIDNAIISTKGGSLYYDDGTKAVTHSEKGYNENLDPWLDGSMEKIMDKLVEDKYTTRKADGTYTPILDWEAVNELLQQNSLKSLYEGTEFDATEIGNAILNNVGIYGGSATGVKGNNAYQNDIIAQMNKNSQMWYDDPANREKYESENQKLGSMLGGNVTYDPSTGKWSGTASSSPTVGNVSSSMIDSLLNAILKREPFSYDHTTDPSYLAYEQQYKRLGDRAREDTLGDIAGLTGGYASSWAASAASQAQNDYNSQLSGIIPQLREAAYNRYLDEDTLMRNDLGLLLGIDQTNYDRYRDTVEDNKWWTEFDYGVSRDEVADKQWQDTFDWNKYVDNWNMLNEEETQTFDQAMSKWNMTGVADESVAAALGVPVGATTESYYFNKANLALSQAKAAQTKKDTSAADQEAAYNKELLVNNAKATINKTESYQEGAKLILAGSGSWSEFYSICSSAGIPDSIAKEVASEYYDAGLQSSLKVEEEVEETDPYLYYADLMGKHEGYESPEDWYYANQYLIPAEILKELRENFINN